MTRWHLALLAGGLLMAGLAAAQEMELQVEIMNQIGTDVSRKGDLISARVVSPAALQGDIVEGKVTESSSGAKLGGKSVFAVNFNLLRHGAVTIPLNAQVKAVANSKGRSNVDEEGRVINRATGNVGKAAAGTGAGALIGGIVGGGRGAAIGAAVGGAASVALIQIAANGPNVHFDSGSRFTLTASARSGPSLASLASAAPAAAAPAPVAQPAAAATPAAAAAPVPQPAAVAPAAAQAPAAASAQPDMTALKATFIPGDKTIFYDDFTDMGPDDAPPHLKVRGASPALMTGGNVRQLKVAQRSSFFPNLTGLPGNFTYETELMFNTAGRAISHLILMSKSSQSLVFTVEGSAGMVHTQLQKKSPYEALGRHRLPANLAEPVKAALWVQNGRVRAFINGEKVLDANQVTLPATTSVELANDLYGATAGFAYRNLRFAESTPDLGQVIMASGRYAVRGILFDTDSDRIKPESAPVIQSIARGLQANAGLKILIEGHTDASGNAQHNLDLSQRRAEALKAVLVAQFSIDAGRLATAGLGAAKPVESNDTPQGRAMNRRVELVRQ